MRLNHDFSGSQKQHGVVLVVCLLMLLLLAIVGLSSVKTTTVEEKMAGNQREHELAFQAAEAALAVAEREIVNNYNSDADGYTGTKWAEYLLNTSTRQCYEGGASGNLTGTCGPDANSLEENLHSNPTAIIWDNAKTVNIAIASGTDLTIRSTGNTTLKKPRYFTQLVSYTVSEGYLFRVTAKGYGGDTNAEVILQSTYQIK